MSNKLLWGSLLIIAILLVSAYLSNRSKQSTLDQERQAAIQQEVQRPEISIDIKHQFKGGKHTFVGSLELPTPCHTISTSVDKGPDQAIVNIVTTASTTVCAQVITPKEFRVVFEGTENENIVAKLNGELVNLNIFEVSPDKNIDTVEIFNKG